jgi:hypothetical protein
MGKHPSHHLNEKWKDTRPRHDQNLPRTRCTARSKAKMRDVRNGTLPADADVSCLAWAMPGQRTCRYHGGLSPRALKAAAERLKDLENPAVDVFEHVLENYRKKGYILMAVRVAETVLDRTGHKLPDKIDITNRQTLDVKILSTATLRQIAAEVQAHRSREVPATEVSPELEGVGEPGDDDDESVH